MRNIRLLLGAEAARWKQRKHIVKIAVLIVLIISTFSYVEKQRDTGQADTGIRLGVAKEDTSAYASLLMEYFSQNKEFTKYVHIEEAERTVLEEGLRLGKLDGYLVIPKDFAQSMLVMENLPMEAVVSLKSPIKSLILGNTMSAYSTYIEAVEANCMALYEYMEECGFPYEERMAANTEISMELIFTALGKNAFFRTRVLEQEETIPLETQYLLNGIYFLLVFFFLSIGIRMNELKQGALLIRLKSTGIGTGHVLCAVVLPYVLFIATISCVLCFGYDVWNPGAVVKVFFSLLLWLCVFAGVGTMIKNKQELLLVCSLLIVLAAIFGGAILPEQYLPDAFISITKWMPNQNFVQVLAGMGGVTG